MKTPQLPVSPLAIALGMTSELWLKREDLHRSGSHKGRSLPLMIKEYTREGMREFVVSSSGNAALAAIIDIEHHNKNKPANPVTLTIYIGERISTEKEQKIHQAIHDLTNISLVKVENPKQAAFLHSQKGPILLRQSTNDLALRGYTELAEELSKIPNLSAVFIPASSGTTAQGIFEGFEHLAIALPQIHIAQIPECHPLVSAVYAARHEALPPIESSENSLASSIVDQVAHRAQKVSEVVIKSKGNGWIITNQELKEMIALVKQTIDIDISPTSALSVAALKKAIDHGYQPAGATVCLITGA